jgi:hypothetical protein
MLEVLALRRILNNVSVDTQFVINVADIRRGRSRRGRKLPLVDIPIEKRRGIVLASGNLRRDAR